MSKQPKKKRSKQEPPEGKPPGEFLTDDLRQETARFLDEVKRQIKRRKEPAGKPRLGPPKPPR